MVEPPVIHHVELCVKDTNSTIKKLRRYGLRPFATRENTFCKQVALKLNSIVFIVNEKISADYRTEKTCKASIRDEPLTVMCSRCEDETFNDEHVDTVFNIALNVKNVKKFFSRAAERIDCDFEKCIIQAPRITQDQFGKIESCIIKSPCGNVIHVALNKDEYKGPFLPGFKMLENVDDDYTDISEIKQNVTQIDHVTLACNSGCSEKIIQFYRSCFGMQKFSISSNDDEHDGLILREGVGLRLRAMEFYRCYETGLICPPSSKNGERTPNSLMLVVVESLAGQTNCNVQTFLNHHKVPGVEHIAFATMKICDTVSQMQNLGVEFRLPPKCYYTELRQRPQIQEIPGLNLEEIAKHGILLDREEDPEAHGEPIKPKYLMQIFAMPLFDRKTVFIEIIQRQGAKGLGAGNIVALVKSIREDEKRKAAEADKNNSTKDARIYRRIS